MTFLLLLLASIAYAFGGVFMKLSVGLTRPGASGAVFALFIAGAALQSVAMRREDLGTAYVLVLGLEAILAFALGVGLFHETCTAAKLAGVALVLVGIALLHK